MNRFNPRTISSLVVAAIAVVVLALGAFGTQTDAPSQPASQSSTTAAAQSSSASATSSAQASKTYSFRSKKLLKEHFNKHGIVMGFPDAQAYAAAANEVIANPAALHKLEAEDGDDVYYLEATDELVIVSTDGYIRTYFNPGGIGYFNRQ